LNAKQELLKNLCLRWHAPSPQLALKEALNAAFPELQQLVPPISVNRLAGFRNVARISERDLNCDGLISRTSTGHYLVEVNRDHAEARRRFTVAHEIAHTFFFDVEEPPRNRVEDGNLDAVNGFDPEEMLCNWAAAEMLMPQRQFHAMVRGLGLGSASLIQLSRNFNVSLHAAARRLLQNCGLRLVIAEWEYSRNNDCYISNWVVASFRRLGWPVPLAVRANDPAFKFFHEPRTFRGEVWISLGGPLDGYFVDTYARVLGHTRKVLTVFVLDRNPSSVLSCPAVPEADDSQLALF
jgi:hypothetical protein